MSRQIGFFLLFIICCAFTARTQQNLSIASFKEIENDLTAQLAETQRSDQNGKPAALLKVVTTETGFSFDVGVMGVVATEQKNGEIWVYVPERIRHLTVSHPVLGVLRNYNIPVAVKSGRTYEVTLISGTVRTIVEKKVSEGWIVFNITPPDATLELDSKILELNEEGQGMKFMEYGSYNYRIDRPDYHTENGIIEFYQQKLEKHIALRPAFGWLALGCHKDFAGATVYIDGENCGTLPLKPTRLPSGNHTIRVAKPLFAQHRQTVTITDSDTLKSVIKLIADYRTVTVDTDADADIYINNERMGTGTWEGALEAGSYLFEARKQGHRTSSVTRTVEHGHGEEMGVTLPSPEPIYGAINIISNPINATIEIDGKLAGETPYLIKDVIIGTHEITLRKENHTSKTLTVNVAEGETAEVSADLDNTCLVRITSNTPADVFIDGRHAGTTPCSETVACGEHQFTLSADGYRTATQAVNVSESNSTVNIPLESTHSEVTITPSNRYASLYVNGEYIGIGEKTMKLPFGTYNIQARYYDEGKAERSVTVGPSTSYIYLDVKMNRIKDKAFYMGGIFHCMNFTGAGAMMGFFAGKVNFEVNFLADMAERQPVYWLDNTGNKVITSQYKAYQIGAKIGYGIRLGNHLRVTPQIGAATWMLVEDSSSTGYGNYGEALSAPCAVAGTVSAQLSWVISSWLNLTVAPEYRFAMIQSDGFKSMSENISHYNDLLNGFGLETGISFIF